MRQIGELKATIARLQKDSHNSSKPPASDIVKPKTAAQKNNHGKPLNIGGQKGRKKHERTPFSPDQVDEYIEVTLDACPICGGALHEHEQVVTKQQIEIVQKSYMVKEYHCHTYTCSACETTHTAREPEESRSGLFSTGLIALAAYLKGRCHVSFRALQAFFQDVLGIVVSVGFPAKQIKKACEALKGAHEQLREKVKGEGQMYWKMYWGRSIRE